jgi:hypothetical protein
VLPVEARNKAKRPAVVLHAEAKTRKRAVAQRVEAKKRKPAVDLPAEAKRTTAHQLKTLPTLKAHNLNLELENAARGVGLQDAARNPTLNASKPKLRLACLVAVG